MENQEEPEVVRISTALEMLGCGRNKFYEKYNHRIRSFFNDTGYIKLFYLEDVKKIQQEVRRYKLVGKNVKLKKKHYDHNNSSIKKRKVDGK